MKQLIFLVFTFTALSSFAQDTLDFSLLKFKKLKKKEFLVDAQWNYERPCDLPDALPVLFADLDTNRLSGELIADKEWEDLHLDKEKIQEWDTIEKCGKVTMGKHTAYIVRYTYGSMPEHVYLHIYNEKGKQVHEQELANHEYGESGASCLFSFVRLDPKNKCIVMLSYTEMEGWYFNEDVSREDGTTDDEYCNWWNTMVKITSINMQTMQIEHKTYNNGGRDCE